MRDDDEAVRAREQTGRTRRCDEDIEQSATSPRASADASKRVMRSRASRTRVKSASSPTGTSTEWTPEWVTTNMINRSRETKYSSIASSERSTART